MPAHGDERALVFVMTDVEGSTRLWEEDAAVMSVAMRMHDALAQRVISAHAGLFVHFPIDLVEDRELPTVPEHEWWSRVRDAIAADAPVSSTLP
jgi:hypothetical protein